MSVRVCACIHVCARVHTLVSAQLGKEGPTRAPSSPHPSGSLLLLTCPPFLASTLFANTLSSSPCPAWLLAQTKATTQEWIVCHWLPSPLHIPPSAPAVATRCCLVGGWQTMCICVCEMTPRTPGLWVPAKAVGMTAAILGSQWGA